MHCFVNSEMKSYSHQPFMKPAPHVHWYVWCDTAASVDDKLKF